MGLGFQLYIYCILYDLNYRMAEEENQELDEESLRVRETVILDIGKKFRDDGNAKELENMIKMIRPFTKLLSKAKAAKLIRGLVDMYLDMETDKSGTRAVQAVELCKECIQWATEEKRIFLRQVFKIFNRNLTIFGYYRFIQLLLKKK